MKALIFISLVYLTCSTTTVNSRIDKYVYAKHVLQVNGRTIYEKNCDLCHSLHDPSNFTKEKLQKVVPKMVKKVNRKKGHFISPENEKILINYLVSKGK